MQITTVVTSRGELNLNSLYELCFTSLWAAETMQDSFAFLIRKNVFFTMWEL